MKRIGRCIASAFVCLLAGRAGAAPLVYEFTSTLAGVANNYGSTFQPPPGFTAGETVSVSLTLDPSIADSLPGDPTRGRYPVLALSVNVGGTVLEYDPSRLGDSAELRVDNPSPEGVFGRDDIFIVAEFGPGIFPTPPQDQYTAHIIFGLPPHTTLHSDAFDFSLQAFQWDFGVSVFQDINNHVDASAFGTLQHVPEPGAGLLLGAGALVLGALRLGSRSARD